MEGAGRSPHGERGLKWKRTPRISCALCRSPHGERGLKLVVSALIVSGQVVALLMESVD